MKICFNTVDDLRRRSDPDPATHCWHWRGAKRKGRPRIWAADLDHMDKRVLSGPRAVWYIAHGTRLGALSAYMRCWCADCVCPAHVEKGTRAAVTMAAARAGLMNGFDDVRAANAAKARAAAGHVDTPPELVRALRAAAGTEPTSALAQRLGIERSVAYRILRGVSHRGVGGGHG